MKSKNPINKHSLTIDSAALTDQGQRRKLNEDAVFQWTEQIDNGGNVGLYIVCDGFGGHGAGDVASNLAVQTISTESTELFTALKTISKHASTQVSSKTVLQYIEAAIKKANDEIRHHAQAHPQDASNMGTTLILAVVYNGIAYLANVGDSRAYVWRDGEIVQLTRDHSMAAELVASGEIDRCEFPGHPFSHILYRSLGAENDLTVDLFEWELQPQDKLLLCSDGLWQAFPDNDDLADWFDVAADARQLCRCLLVEANERYGEDNISAVVVEVDEKLHPAVQDVLFQVAPMLVKPSSTVCNETALEDTFLGLR